MNMTCPGTDIECDNPGCRRGGCQGRPPERKHIASADCWCRPKVVESFKETPGAGAKDR